ncbi:hypothetical protein IT087_02260 [Candidatus Uhrbacteria bacterium]|nr:hypothetical protein [Candidatus Uhrbacteria bacterium]
MRLWLTGLVLVVGCASVTRPPSLETNRLAESGWTDEPGALILLVNSPLPYLTILNAFPFRLRIGLLERTPSRMRYGETYAPLGPRAEETLWVDELPLTAFLNTERFVRHGYIGIRPVGITRVPNPLREQCPSDLVRAATADLHGHNLRILEVRTRRRDDRYGCVYGFRYVTD